MKQRNARSSSLSSRYKEILKIMESADCKVNNVKAAPSRKRWSSLSSKQRSFSNKKASSFSTEWRMSHYEVIKLFVKWSKQTLKQGIQLLSSSLKSVLRIGNQVRIESFKIQYRKEALVRNYKPGCFPSNNPTWVLLIHNLKLFQIWLWLFQIIGSFHALGLIPESAFLFLLEDDSRKDGEGVG